MIDLVLVQNFLVSLVLGALIGLEREYARYRKKGYEYAGIRTFPLISLFGALSAYLGDMISPWILLAGMILMGVVIIIAYFMIVEKNRVYLGATSEIAGFLTFFIGVLCFYGELTLAVILAIVITSILYARSALHNFAKKISPQELKDTIKFAIIAFVILPFLPNKGYGPLGIFNPYIIWLMVVLISGISLGGYILMKWIGEKGISLAGILGGMISSTAVTTSFAQRSKKEGKIFRALALGVILSNGMMFFRILIEIFILNRSLVVKMILPLLSLAAVSAIFSYFIWKKARKVEGKIKLGSPFTLRPALKFGIFFAIVLALVKVGDYYFSSKGVYLVSLVSGFAGVDAITVSLSQLAKSSLTDVIASKGIIMAIISNITVKGFITYWLGGKEFSKLVLGLFAILIVLGIGLLFVF